MAPSVGDGSTRAPVASSRVLKERQCSLHVAERDDGFVESCGQDDEGLTDTISTAQFVLPQAALDVALTATNVTVFDASKKVRVWFEATNAVSFRAAFSGKTIEVDHTITTTGGRRFNETIELKIREN